MANTPTSTPVGVSRREFLAASAQVLAATVSGAATGTSSSSRSGVACILLWLTGGPSQLDTFDPKPDAPESVRGPFRPIATRVPGILLSETLPLLAQLTDRFSLIRTLHHEEAPIHETGQQLLQTGRLSTAECEVPHLGSVLSWLGRAPTPLLLPGPLGHTGVSVSHGQSAGFLGHPHEPFTPLNWERELEAEPVGLRERYGATVFGRACLAARRQCEQGRRFVTVNMYPSVFDELTWDCHANGAALNTRLEDYRTTICPVFDQACSALIEDLHQRGMLDNTLVLAVGEFGRTPELNSRGGRDHWPSCWSALLSGGGIRGGYVVGRSDRCAGEPADRPVTPGELLATVYWALGVDPTTRLSNLGPLAEGEPIKDLFGIRG